MRGEMMPRHPCAAVDVLTADDALTLREDRRSGRHDARSPALPLRHGAAFSLARFLARP